MARPGHCLTDCRLAVKIDRMAKYKTIGMLRSGLQKELNDATNGGGHAPYLDERERLPYLVTAYGGRLYQSGAPLDTTGVANSTYLYVMDGEGRVFAAASDELNHHSAFLAGNPVAAAGSIEVVVGRLSSVFDQSGHYMPPLDYTLQFLKEMKSRGIDTLGITRDFMGAPKSRIKRFLRTHGGPRERLYPTGSKSKLY